MTSGRFVNRPYARNQSCACRAGACSRRGVRCKLTAGAKFSEFGHPFVCFADISPIRGITPPYPVKCISCVGNGLDRSVKLHQNLRAGVVTRPYNGAPSRRSLRSHYSLPVPLISPQTPIFCHFADAKDGRWSSNLRIASKKENGHAKAYPFLLVIHRRFNKAAPCRFASQIKNYLSLLLTQKMDDGVRISATKKEQPDCVGLFLFGDPPEIRTPDTLIKSQVLCQLS